MFINFSNHVSEKWSDKQLEEARKYGKLVDIRFPHVDPYCTDEQINEMVDKFYNEIMKYDNPVVMLQGEFVLSYRLINKLKASGVKVVAGCSERRTIEYVEEDSMTTRKSEFEFVMFKEF